MPSLKLTALENSRCVIRKEQNLLFKKEDKNKKHNNKNIYHSVQEFFSQGKRKSRDIVSNSEHISLPSINVILWDWWVK